MAEPVPVKRTRDDIETSGQVALADLHRHVEGWSGGLDAVVTVSNALTEALDRCDALQARLERVVEAIKRALSIGSIGGNNRDKVKLMREILSAALKAPIGSTEEREDEEAAKAADRYAVDNLGRSIGIGSTEEEE